MGMQRSSCPCANVLFYPTRIGVNVTHHIFTDEFSQYHVILWGLELSQVIRRINQWKLLELCRPIRRPLCWTWWGGRGIGGGGGARGGGVSGWGRGLEEHAHWTAVSLLTWWEIVVLGQTPAVVADLPAETYDNNITLVNWQNLCLKCYCMYWLIVVDVLKHSASQLIKSPDISRDHSWH